MSDFISNIETANTRLNQLEAQLGLPRSEFVGNCDEVNATIVNLEAKLAARPKQQAAPTKAAAIQPVVKKLPNDLAAIKRSGKVFGIGKAMIAATEQANLRTK